MSATEASFWEHLDELRICLLRCLLVVGLAGIAAFALKETLFDIVLAPRSSEFVTYRLLHSNAFSISLMNTELTEQFFTHMKVALYAGLLLASPYVVWQLFGFIAPALYDKERHVALRVGGAAYAMFMVGVFVSYFIVFPLTLKFLATYQVSPDVRNMLTLQSYIDTLLMLSLVMGIVFELPVVCALLSRMNILHKGLMQHYRRHAIVAILIAAAIITPSGDAFTLFVVALPIYLLYEVSILLVKKQRMT